MGKVATLVLAILLLGNATARADDFSDEMRLREAMGRLRQLGDDAVAKGQHYPVVELLTMGVGSLIWERHGHIAMCIIDENPRRATCYNYGVADLAREGFYGVGHYVPLIITDLAMGRVTDRVPTYWERMFLPDYLREAVQKMFGVTPIPIYVRSQCVASTAPGCSERGAPYENPASGRLWFVLVTLLLAAPAWATRLWGRLQRTGMAIAVIPYVFLGTIFWFLAIISPLQYVRWNESCLLFLPVDIVLVWFLSDERRRLYAKGRLVMLGLVAVLMLVGELRQPILYALVWPLIPNAVAAFMPLRTTLKKCSHSR